MAVVTFVSHDGKKHEVPFQEGQSLMQVATNTSIRSGPRRWASPAPTRRRCSR
ncbi:ferredoxin [Mycobacteroides abscessus subsp. abscessus]|nr:ferredoxin [Mycobacteroides abscessus subsp. abscessus]